MRRPVALIFGISLVVIIKVHCHEYSGPVVNRVNDLTDEVVEMKMDLARLELKVRNQIDLAKISLGIELNHDMQQHVREVMADIIQGESIEEMVSSRVVSEVRQLKRGNHIIKRQLGHVMNSLRDVQKERDDYREALEKAKSQSPELKCVIYTEARGTETKAHDNFTNSPLQLEQSVSNLTLELQSIKMEQDTLNISVSATGQGLLSTRSEMTMVQAAVNVTGNDVLSMKSELTQLQASLNDAEQDILSTRTDMKMVQDSVNVTGKDMLLMKSELTQFQAVLNVLSSKSKFAAVNTSRLSAMEERIVQLEKAIKNIDPIVYFKAYSSKRQTVSKGDTLKFDNVVANIGHGYDQHSGVFTAPVTGIYMLAVILGTVSSGAGDFAISSAGETEAYISIKDGYDVGPMTTLAHVKKGHQVFVIRAFGGPKQLREWRLTQFSGLLLRAD